MSYRFEILNNEFSLMFNDKEILNENFLYVGKGNEDIKMYRGNFKISDYVESRIKLTVSNIKKNDKSYEIEFSNGFIGEFKFENNRLDFSFIKINEEFNRCWFRLKSSNEQKIFGLGEQMSYLNLKGRDFPIWTSEPGVGRDKSTYLTWKSDVESMAGGDYYNSNYPEPTFLTSDFYYFNLHSTAYSCFNFKNAEFNEIEVWQCNGFSMEFSSNYVDLIGVISNRFGRQPKLPEWVYNGVILGLQGGTDRMMHLYEKSKSYNMDISGLWVQDWEGKKHTSFGKRLNWHWQWDKDFYPNLDKKIKDLNNEQVKVLGYINPYLLKDTFLYKQAYDLGYFATKFDGTDYLVDFGEFDCGVVDFTNDEAYNWFKEVIKKEMIEFGLTGWMADFGEYLPTDLKLFKGDALIEHNRWPVLWAKCNYEALVETNNLGNILYFMRAGGNGTQKYCPLLWAGDQSVDFSIHDGLASTIVGALSSGLVGNAYSHSDIGGYTSLFGNTRNKQLFLRWAEMSVFTPVMRTHEGNRPDSNFQYYDDEDCLVKFSRLTNIYKKLSTYTKFYSNEASETGLPMQRALFIHYDEEQCYKEQFSYLYGRDLLVAPVYKENVGEWEVFLPNDSWIHLWSGKTYSGGKHLVESQVGYPPVFYKADSQFVELFKSLGKM